MERTGIFCIPAMLRQLKLRCSGHPVKVDDARLPKHLFYGDATTDTRRQGGPKRRYKDTLKNSPKRLHINPETWKDLTQNRQALRGGVKTGAAIYEGNRIAVSNAIKEAHK
ncbi:hypothetical protein SprV_0401416100 [Sparganum proliferum]